MRSYASAPLSISLFGEATITPVVVFAIVAVLVIAALVGVSLTLSRWRIEDRIRRRELPPLVIPLRAALARERQPHAATAPWAVHDESSEGLSETPAEAPSESDRATIVRRPTVPRYDDAPLEELAATGTATSSTSTVSTTSATNRVDFAPPSSFAPPSTTTGTTAGDADGDSANGTSNSTSNSTSNGTPSGASNGRANRGGHSRRATSSPTTDTERYVPLVVDDDMGQPLNAQETVRFRRTTDEPVQLLPGRLEVLAGEKRHREIRFVRVPGELPQLILGREGGSSPQQVALESTTVSRRHARFAFADGQWGVANLSQTNPLVVNDEVLNAVDAPRALADGDRIELGDVVLRFRAH